MENFRKTVYAIAFTLLIAGLLMGSVDLLAIATIFGLVLFSVECIGCAVKEKDKLSKFSYGVVPLVCLWAATAIIYVVWCHEILWLGQLSGVFMALALFYGVAIAIAYVVKKKKVGS